MPALPPAPGVIKITLPYALPGDANAQSRFYMHYSGTAPTAAQLTTFCNSVESNFHTVLGPYLSTASTMGIVQAEDLSSSSGAVGVGTTSHAGTRAGSAPPPGTCLDVQFTIARRYRGGKPKMFTPFGVTADFAAGGVWSAGLTNSVGTDFPTFISDIAAAGWTGAGTLTHVSVSYYSGFTVVTNPVTHRARNVPTLRGTPTVDPVIAYVIEPSFGSQRRRNVI